MASGPASFARIEDTATRARGLMDEAAAAVEASEAAQRELVRIGVSVWADSAWLAAGAASFQAWARTYTTLTEREALQLERVSQLCFDHPTLAEAVGAGVLSLARVRRLARWVTRDRRRYLTDAIVATLLDLNAKVPGDDEAWGRAVAFWAEQVDQELAVTPEHDQRLYLSERLFGGGEVHGALAPVTFETVAAALEAFIQDPDPNGAPYQRTLAERRADALEDLALFGLTHTDEDSIHPNDDDWDGGGRRTVADNNGTPDRNESTTQDHDNNINHPTDTDGGDDRDGGTDDAGWDVEVDEHGVYDGLGDRDVLGELLADLRHGDGDLDPLDALRQATAHKLMAQGRRARRMVKPRSGVTVNVHVDLATLAGRDLGDLDGIVLRTDAWRIAERAARQMLCDSALVATLFNGPGHVLDANDIAEQFSRAQRRAIAARDHHCVFPSCKRPPRFCDTHHLHHREHGGPTKVDNGCLLCRFHHRLIHQHAWTLELVNGRWVATDPHGNAWIGQPRPNGPPDNRSSDADHRDDDPNQLPASSSEDGSITTPETPEPPMLC